MSSDNGLHLQMRVEAIFFVSELAQTKENARKGVNEPGVCASKSASGILASAGEASKHASGMFSS